VAFQEAQIIPSTVDKKQMTEFFNCDTQITNI